jgi:PQQ-dependent dehydrogenase (methanol/ethanol family)
MSRPGSLSLLVLVAALAASPAHATPNDVRGTSAPAFDPTRLARFAAVNWPTVGGDYEQDRYSRLGQINVGNVSRLKVAWHVQLDGSATGPKYRGEATPIVFGGVMYIVTGNDDVFALDATTGARIWTHLSHLDQNINTVCCGWDARGVAIGDGRIYVAQLDDTLVALSQQDGRVVWTASNGRWQEGYTMTMAPLYYNGLVIVGVSGAEFGARGSVTAYDARDGHRVWRFAAVPAPGSFGSETWPSNNEWQNGGGTVFNTPSVDVRTGLLYFTTGNAGPWSGRGPGDNLFTSSFVALDAMTGAYAWHFQVVHHDLWDYDCPSPTVLFDATFGGRLGSAIAESCKTGWMYVLDRRNGTPLLEIDEKPVPQNAFNNTSPTQPIPRGDAFAEQCATPGDFPDQAPDGNPYTYGCVYTPYDNTKFTAVAPGTAGGAVQGPSSYNPDTGYLYVCSANSRFAAKAVPTQASPYESGNSLVGVDGSAPAGRFVTSGDLVAMNAQTNRIAWKKHYALSRAQRTGNRRSAACTAGSTTTAGGLVFAGLPESLAHAIVAYDAAGGRELWRFVTDAGIEGPASTYLGGDGRQYVAVYAGGRTSWTSGAHGDSVYAFALDR